MNPQYEPEDWDESADFDDEVPTVLCPHCGQPIPDFADRCHHCGDWVPQTVGDTARRSPWFVIIAVLTLIGFVLFFVF